MSAVPALAPGPSFTIAKAGPRPAFSFVPKDS
jgi:hypothetical protein